MRRTPSIEIIFRDIDRSTAAEEFAREQIEKLLALFEGADARQMTVEAHAGRRGDGKEHRIRIALATEPGTEARRDGSGGSRAATLVEPITRADDPHASTSRA